MDRPVNSFREEIPQRPIPNRRDLEPLFFEFFNQFKDNLAEYVRESVTELAISEVLIDKPVQVFSGITRGKARIKNQGNISCFISTDEKKLGYRLDPNEAVDIYVNNEVYVTTLSGTTDIGFIKY